MQTDPPPPPFFEKHFKSIVAAFLLILVVGLLMVVGLTAPAALLFNCLTGWLVVPFAVVTNAWSQPEVLQPGLIALSIGLIALATGLALLPRAVRRIRLLSSAVTIKDATESDGAKELDSSRLKTSRIAGLIVSGSCFLICMLMTMVTSANLVAPPPPRMTEHGMNKLHLRAMARLSLEARLLALTEDRMPSTMAEFMDSASLDSDEMRSLGFQLSIPPIYIGGIDTHFHRDIPIFIVPPAVPNGSWIACSLDSRWLQFTEAEWRGNVPEWKARLAAKECRWPPMLDPAVYDPAPEP